MSHQLTDNGTIYTRQTDYIVFVEILILSSNLFLIV